MRFPEKGMQMEKKGGESAGPRANKQRSLRRGKAKIEKGIVDKLAIAKLLFN